MVTLRCITTPWQDWCMWGLRSASETDKLPGCTLWKLTKLEPNIRCTRLPMQSTGICTLVVWRGALPIEIWTTDRQTWWMVRYLCQSSPKWQRPVMLSKELHCVCVAHSWNLQSISWQAGFNVLVSGSKDETKEDLIDSAQWCYQMKCTICVQAHLRANIMLNFCLVWMHPNTNTSEKFSTNPSDCAHSLILWYFDRNNIVHCLDPPL